MTLDISPRKGIDMSVIEKLKAERREHSKNRRMNSMELDKIRDQIVHEV